MKIRERKAFEHDVRCSGTSNNMINCPKCKRTRPLPSPKGASESCPTCKNKGEVNLWEG